MILACRQLHKAYGIDVILEKITFHIEEREKAAIVGVNLLVPSDPNPESGHTEL